MITAILYRLYGWLIRLPGLGPRIERWIRAHRGLAYCLRNLALRLDGAGRASTGVAPAAPTALQDLEWMLVGLRTAVSQLQRRLDVLDGRHVGEPPWQAALDAHSHALNLKVDGVLEALTRRVERAERHLGQAILQSTQPLPAPRILNPHKLAQHRDRPQGLWLELGCGERPDPERINIDLRPLPGVDIIAHVGQLPLPDASVRDLRAAHLVEHFTLQQFADRILPEWRRVLAPGGRLRLITPDLAAMLRAHLQGQLSEADLVHVLYGGQDYEGDFHYHAYSPASLSALLATHGFADIQVVAHGRPNGLCLEFELLAHAGALTTAADTPDAAATSASN
ncbi:hypothetical protein Tfont_02306 [Tepidimonas fonticaldi]|uniref:Methyltransferase type 11 domain-containing protein n=1 Tax=Tepidimonas fonticaldi TaxID=1101373 RepID=A0A554XHM9_9BURK|nr:hypothetical protein [Tepidimonas fonticaldi]TSE35332.1 hypothetical protein Tfont_02306 [Tepidimonas fonticaldi]